jgi:FG-GAP-like repeat/FG-GAP repeat
VAVADFNGDGHLDLAVANEGTHDVSVLLGNGDGSFQAANNFPAELEGSVPVSLAVADFDGDGHLDLAVMFPGGVRMLSGNGDGSFQTPPVSYVAGVYPGAIAVGDFNGDGLPDLAVANSGGGINR